MSTKAGTEPQMIVMAMIAERLYGTIVMIVEPWMAMASYPSLNHGHGTREATVSSS